MVAGKCLLKCIFCSESTVKDMYAPNWWQVCAHYLDSVNISAFQIMGGIATIRNSLTWQIAGFPTKHRATIAVKSRNACRSKVHERLLGDGRPAILFSILQRSSPPPHTPICEQSLRGTDLDQHCKWDFSVCVGHGCSNEGA